MGESSKFKEMRRNARNAITWSSDPTSGDLFGRLVEPGLYSKLADILPGGVFKDLQHTVWAMFYEAQEVFTAEGKALAERQELHKAIEGAIKKRNEEIVGFILDGCDC